MRTVLYCASMIAVTSCVSANARPYAGTPPTINCNDRMCASAPTPTGSWRNGAARRVRVGRYGYVRTYVRINPVRIHSRYSRQRMVRIEARPRTEFAPQTSRSAQGMGHYAGGTVTIQTAANPITVSARIAGPMRALIADLVAHGYRGHVTCLASGHMPGSLHHIGEACDFAQLRRNVVAPGAGIMYHASAIIAAHGLRDGCSFHDCGHVDSGRMLVGARAQWTAGARRVRRAAWRYVGYRRLYRVAHRSWR